MPRAGHPGRSPSPVDEQSLPSNGGGYSAGARASVSTPRALVSYLKTLSNTIASRLNFAARAGLTFKGQRNLDRALGRLEDIEPSNYTYRANRGDIASLIISKLPKAAWKFGAKIIEDEDASSSTPWELEVAELFERLNIWWLLREADIESRKGRYAIVVIGVPSSYGRFETELTPLLSPNDLLYLTPYNESQARITKRITDKSDPRVGWPLEYQVTLDDHQHIKVHRSRVIHIADSMTPFMCPILEKTWDRLDDYDKVVGGASETTWQSKGTLWTTQPDTTFESSELQAIPGSDTDVDAYTSPTNIEGMITALRHDALADVILEGIDAKQLGGTVPNVSPLARLLIRVIMGTQEIPERVALGTEEGKLAGEQDSAEWGETIVCHWNGPCTRYTKQTISKLVELNVLTAPAGVYQVVRPKVDKHTAKDLAEITRIYSRANRDNVTAQGEIVLTTDEIREVIGMGPLDEQSSAGTSTTNATRATTNATRALISSAEVISIVESVVDSNELAVSNALSSIFDSASNTIDSTNLSTLESSIDSVVANLEQPLAIEDQLTTAIVNAAQANVSIADSTGSWLRTAIEFNTVNPRIAAWASSHSASRISDIAQDTRAGLNALIVESTSQSWTVAQTASRMSSSVGLLSREIDWVLGLSRNLVNASPNTIVTYGTTRVNIPSTGVTQTLVDNHVDRYIDRLLTARRRRIARSELAAAANEGLHESWRQALEQDELPDNIFRVYIKNTERHATRDGQLARINEPFEVEPGADANCACAQGLVVVN